MVTNRGPNPITDKMREDLQKAQMPVFATIIPSRTTKPAVALHTRVGQAKNAVQAQTAPNYQGGRASNHDRSRGGYPLREAEVYELADFVNGKGVWRLKWRIEEGTYPDDLPWRK